MDASRRWRRGVRTFLVADKVLPFQLRVNSSQGGEGSNPGVTE